MKNDSEIMYKVFRNMNGMLSSITLYSEHTIQYARDNGWYVPNTGKLFVFDTLENAQSFAKCIIGKTEIWQVDVKEVYPCPSDVAVKSCYFEDYWSKCKETYVTSNIPIGTILTDGVKLIRKEGV